MDTYCVGAAGRRRACHRDRPQTSNLEQRSSLTGAPDPRGPTSVSPTSSTPPSLCPIKDHLASLLLRIPSHIRWLFPPFTDTQILQATIEIVLMSNNNNNNNIGSRQMSRRPGAIQSALAAVSSSSSKKACVGLRLRLLPPDSTGVSTVQKAKRPLARRFGGESAGKSSTLIWTNELRGQGCTALGQYAFRGPTNHLQLDDSRRLVGPAGIGDGLAYKSRAKRRLRPNHRR